MRLSVSFSTVTINDLGMEDSLCPRIQYDIELGSSVGTSSVCDVFGFKSKSDTIKHWLVSGHYR